MTGLLKKSHQGKLITDPSKQLFPLPTSATGVNENLVQNPGYLTTTSNNNQKQLAGQMENPACAGMIPASATAIAVADYFLNIVAI